MKVLTSYGVDLEAFSPSPLPVEPGLVFTGTMDYWPNVDAAHWENLAYGYNAYQDGGYWYYMSLGIAKTLWRKHPKEAKEWVAARPERGLCMAVATDARPVDDVAA